MHFFSGALSFLKRGYQLAPAGSRVLLGHEMRESVAAGGIGLPLMGLDLGAAVFEGLLEVGQVESGMIQHPEVMLLGGFEVATGELELVVELSLKSCHSDHLMVLISSSWAVLHPEVVRRNPDSCRVSAAARAYWTRC